MESGREERQREARRGELKKRVERKGKEIKRERKEKRGLTLTDKQFHKHRRGEL